MMWKIPSSLLFAGLMVTVAHGQTLLTPLPQQAVGVWADENGESNIEISSCGTTLCGRVVWLKHPTDASGQPVTDEQNPEKALRSRPLLGLKIISGLRFEPQNKYLRGKVYNADDGKTYDLYLKPAGRTMQVKGCFLKVLCDTQTWTRVR